MKKKKILIAGSAGQLGSEFVRVLEKRNDYDYVAPEESDFSITDYDQVRKVVSDANPDIIINCAAYNAVDDAEDNPDIAFAVNRDAVRNLAEVCRENNIFFIHYSSDYVFDGTKMDFYVEDDEPNPLNVYGKSKLEGERAVQEILDEYLIFRLSWVFGRGKQNFLYKLSQWAEKNSVLKISADEVSVPTYTGTIVDVTLKSIERGVSGLYHLTNSGYASRYELARYYMKKKGLGNFIVPVPMETFPVKATRPGFSAMSNQKISDDSGIIIPSWEDGIDDFVSASII